MKLALTTALLVLLAACGGGPGYVNTDVPEPVGMRNPKADGVRFQGKQLMEGTLTYVGKGDIVQVYQAYINDMRGMDWNLSSTDGDSSKGYQLKFMKDMRVLSASITPMGAGAPDPSVQVTLKVNASAGR